MSGESELTKKCKRHKNGVEQASGLGGKHLKFQASGDYSRRIVPYKQTNK